MSIHVRHGRIALVVALLAASGAGVVAWSQSRPDDPNGTLAGVIAELRQLRQAVEEGARNQTQTQALGVFLSAQQSRLIQVTTQIDKIRAELADASKATADVTERMASAQRSLAVATDVEQRTHFERLIRDTKVWADQAAAREQALRAREAELVVLYQADEQRWGDLIARLDQLIKR